MLRKLRRGSQQSQSTAVVPLQEAPYVCEWLKTGHDGICLHYVRVNNVYVGIEFHAIARPAGRGARTHSLHPWMYVYTPQNQVCLSKRRRHIPHSHRWACSRNCSGLADGYTAYEESVFTIPTRSFEADLVRPIQLEGSTVHVQPTGNDA